MSVELVACPPEAPLALPPGKPGPAAVYLAGLAEGSRSAQRSALETMAEMLVPGLGAERLPWYDLRYEHTQALRAKLVDRYDYRTVNRMLVALRRVLEEAWRLGLMSAEDYHRARAVRSITGSKPPQGRALSVEEVQRLVAAAGTGARGARDQAVLALLFGGGLRRAEASLLDLADLSLGASRCLVRGKRRKQRIVDLPPDAQRLVTAWLGLRGPEPGPLLVSITKTGALRRRGGALARLARSSIYLVLARLAERAELEGRIAPHDARRTRITSLLASGVDLAQVQRLAGHESPKTTAQYDRRGEDALREAVRGVSALGGRREPAP